MKKLLHYIHTYPHRTKSLLGIDYEQFTALLAQLQQAEAQQLARQQAQKTRINAPGAGRPSRLTTQEEILLCLFYLRHHPTFEVLGLAFEISPSQAHALFHYWLTLLRQVLPASLFEELGDSPAAWSVMEELLLEWELIVDSTEQSRQRPGEAEDQKRYYSGKKKQMTDKHQLIGLPDGQDIVDIEVAYPGPTADVTLFRSQQGIFDEQQEFAGDKAYQGAARTRTPHKKPKGNALTPAQVESNRVFAGERIVIEHLIRLIKIFRAAKEQVRLHLDNYEQAILAICGLVRLRLGAIQLPIQA